ncbi:MAG: N-acetylglucosamine-6-phosphate deacetylase [Planctomycetia bacterium]|nr:N-acetylglucosamine-6-phosphate deacetylase [Planctomycetia bacterium]
MRPFDLQVNGYAGADFGSTSLDLAACRRACDALAADGVEGILATVITDSIDGLCAKLATLTRHRDADPAVASMIRGFHVEGPFISPLPGYVGAHDPGHVKPANVADMQRILDAGAGLVRLVTLAPEHDAGLATTRLLVGRGVTVSAGHCDPPLDLLRAAIDAGLSMVTHLGNGCPTTLPRHDNVIQRALSLADHLWVCFIPDGAHVPFFALGNYLDVTGLERSIMVTDAIAAATLGPGRYELSGMEVDVDAAGVARRPGSENLAGSTVTMPRVREHLARHLGLSDADIARLVDTNPRRALHLA